MLTGHTRECLTNVFPDADCSCPYEEQMRQDAWEEGKKLHEDQISWWLEEAREIWGHTYMSPGEIVTAMGVIFGDIARQVRDLDERSEIDHIELQKELGNMILSTLRWIDDLGYDPTKCLQLASYAQWRYVEELDS